MQGLMTLLCAVIAAIASIVVAMINHVGNKRAADLAQSNLEFKRRQEERDETISEIQQVMFDALISSLECENVLLIAAKGGHLNGNVESAVKVNEVSRQRLRDVISKSLSRKV